METPVEIAFRHFEPTDEVRTEIAAEMRRLDALSSRITRRRLTVTGPHIGRGTGEAFNVSLRIAIPGRKDIVVDRSHGEAPERARALAAIRQAFETARRRLEEAERELRGEVKVRAQARSGRIAKRTATPS